MTEEEFDVLDELYFLQSFTYLEDTLGLSREKLIQILQQLINKQWVKVYENATDELSADKLSLSSSEATKYLYLASKEGLLAHNGR
ncbi:hypothetical protein AB9P05_14605 [Roseivirga sp. BDSF3-8]|uniref:hypothetical protein n=1 Tax=Roseivirga sp. BDSF3-8 TaxID=3241598 RepID=UPI003531DA49